MPDMLCLLLGRLEDVAEGRWEIDCRDVRDCREEGRTVPKFPYPEVSPALWPYETLLPGRSRPADGVGAELASVESVGVCMAALRVDVVAMLRFLEDRTVTLLVR